MAVLSVLSSASTCFSFFLIFVSSFSYFPCLCFPFSSSSALPIFCLSSSSSSSCLVFPFFGPFFLPGPSTLLFLLLSQSTCFFPSFIFFSSLNSNLPFICLTCSSPLIAKYNSRQIFWLYGTCFWLQKHIPFRHYIFYCW